MGGAVGKLVKTGVSVATGGLVGGPAGAAGAGASSVPKGALSAVGGLLPGKLLGGGGGSGPGGPNPQDIPLHRPIIGKEGVNLLKSYMSGKLTGGQKQIIGQFKKTANAQLQQELAQAGLSKSSAAFGGKEAIDAQAAQISEGFLQQDFSNAVNLLGMNMDAYFAQAGIDVNKAMATAQQDAAFAQALGSIGQGVAMAMG